MTKTKYDANARSSRNLSAKLERLTDKTKYDTWFMRLESTYVNNMEILKLQAQLDELWDEQMSLIDAPFYSGPLRKYEIDRRENMKVHSNYFNI